MKERIRVLRVIARLNVGGPAVHATLLNERLDPARYDCLLVAGPESAGEGNYLALHGRRAERLVTVRELGRRIHPARDVVALHRLYGLMRRFRPHIVHTHTAKAGAVGRVAARLARVPVVVHTYHGHVLDGYFSPLVTRMFTAAERGLARVTDCLLAVTPQVRASILGMGIGRPDQVRVLALGLDLEPLMVESEGGVELRRRLGVAGAPLVGIVARLVPIKRHEDFLAAAAAVVARVPACRFVIVGDGERRSELEALTRRLGLAGRVTFLGWWHDLAALYAALDVVVLCSGNEGSPVSLIEAMAAARPVVATSVGGVPDVVEHGVSGLLTAPGEPSALADAIVALLAADDRRRRMGEAGRKRVYPAFSAHRLIGDVDRLYSDLVAKSRR